jgi:hypothetical protein
MRLLEMEFETLHGAIRMQRRGDLAETIALLAPVEGVLDVQQIDDQIAVYFLAFSPAETAVRCWLRGGKAEDPTIGTSWRKVRKE